MKEVITFAKQNIIGLILGALIMFLIMNNMADGNISELSFTNKDGESGFFIKNKEVTIDTTKMITAIWRNPQCRTILEASIIDSGYNKITHDKILQAVKKISPDTPVADELKILARDKRGPFGRKTQFAKAAFVSHPDGYILSDSIIWCWNNCYWENKRVGLSDSVGENYTEFLVLGKRGNMPPNQKPEMFHISKRMAQKLLGKNQLQGNVFLTEIK